MASSLKFLCALVSCPAERATEGRAGFASCPLFLPLATQVVVHNLPWTTTWQQLKDTFKEWKVERADVVYDSWGKSR